jgi:putative serine/threonine protein kinase
MLKIEELRRNHHLLLQLSYPSPDPDYAALVLGALEELGVEALELENPERLRLIGKGFRNIVLVGFRGMVRVALKVRRLDYAVKSTFREAYMLEQANRVGVGPKLLGHRDPVLVMSLVEGVDLTKWLLHSNPPSSAARHTLLEVAMQCHRLDRARIDHRELSDASKHVIVTQGGPVIIDFGSAGFSSRPKNLTSFINYISSKELEKVRRDLGLGWVERQTLRRYKETYSGEDFEELLSEMKLL